MDTSTGGGVTRMWWNNDTEPFKSNLKDTKTKDLFTGLVDQTGSDNKIEISPIIPTKYDISILVKSRSAESRLLTLLFIKEFAPILSMFTGEKTYFKLCI